VFHCETCDNFVDRNSLIEHMMQHLKERTDAPVVVENEENEAEGSESENFEPAAPKDKRNLLREAAGSNVKFLKKCHYCPKLFSNRSGRLYHQEQAHFNRRRFQCDKCALSFGLKQTLMNHIRNKHSNNVRSFACDLCSKAYKTKSALHNHKVYHSTDDPKYHCNYCPKKFHFNFLLQQHETIHLGLAKSFDCEVCKKSFNTRNKLTKHRGIHADNKYACTIEGCGFKGNLKRYLIAHTKRMHS
jgi:stress-induced morphogen